MPTLAEALAAGQRRLADSDSPEIDAALLLCRALGKPRSHLYAWPERPLSDDEARAFEALLARRAAGEPVAHILGEREFWSLRLKVTPATLIPRPETELLVEQALERIPTDAAWELADLGTGSGAIALALAAERPRCRVTAVERSPEALAVARENGRAAGLTNLEWLTGEWFTPLAGRHFRLIASNPPYIRADDPHLGHGDLRFEPRTALAAGADGLDDLCLIAAAAPGHLLPGGWLLLEHGWDQGAAVRQLLEEAGLEDVSTAADLAGHERVALGRRPA